MILNNTLTTTGGGGSDNIRTPIIYSYVGTGEYGPDHPNVITLDFEPVFIQVLGWFNGSNFILPEKDQGASYIIPGVQGLSTTYQDKVGLSNDTYMIKYCAKKSDNGKTISWYCQGYQEYSASPLIQYNELNYTYRIFIV